MAVKRRKLSAAEQALFPQSFRDAIKIGNVTLIARAHNPFAKGKVLTRGHKIYWPDCPQDFTKEILLNQALLMHELCHVWQYHTNRLSGFGYLTSPKSWGYKYVYDTKKKFDDYPTEKQADLLRDWYLINNGQTARYYNKEKSIRPTKTQINAVVPFTW